MSLTPSHSPDALLQELRFLDARPFAHQVCQSPWNDLPDVDALHPKARQAFRRLLRTFAQPGGRPATDGCLAGRVRQDTPDFVDASPRQCATGSGVRVRAAVPAGPGPRACLEEHVLEAVFEVVWHRYPAFKDLLARRVLSLLVEKYDELVISTSDPFRELALKAGSLSWPLFKRSYRIGARVGRRAARIAPQGPRVPAVPRRRFRQIPRYTAGEQGRWRAGRRRRLPRRVLLGRRDRGAAGSESWFRGQIGESAPERGRFAGTRAGADKARDAIYTVQQLAGLTLCLAFDQLEDTSNR